MSKEELGQYVDELLAEDATGTYDFAFQAKHVNPKGLPTREMMIKHYRYLLEEEKIYSASFNSSANKCSRGIAYLTDELPWNTF